MSGHRELTKDVDIDIPGLFSNIWKMKWLILIVSVLAGGGIFFLMNSISPRYQTSAQLIIEPRESQFTRVEQLNGGFNSSEFDTAAVLSQVQIILSDAIALATIKKLDLATKDEFQVNDEPSMLSDLFVVAGLKNESLNIPPEERVLKSFKKRLKAYTIENSRVIEILFWANDRQLAKQITNTIADEYLQLQRNSKLETDSNASKFLEPEIADLRSKVRAAEAKVAQYRSNSDILLGTNNALLATQQLSEVSTELSRVRAQKSAAQAKVDSIRSTIKTGASLEAIPEVVASPLIQRLRERQVQLRAQISELSTIYLPAHPRLKALKSQVSDFEKQILREARGILASLKNNVVIASAQEKSLIRELGRLKSEAARVGEAEVELRALEREAVSERELLQAYMIKFREVAGRQSSNYLPINARIISGAHLPTESFFPKTVPYTIAGTLVTTILTMVAILTLSLLSGKAFKTVANREPSVDGTMFEMPKQAYNEGDHDGASHNRSDHNKSDHNRSDHIGPKHNRSNQSEFAQDERGHDESVQDEIAHGETLSDNRYISDDPDFMTVPARLRETAGFEELPEKLPIENSFKLDNLPATDKFDALGADISPPPMDIGQEMDSGQELYIGKEMLVPPLDIGVDEGVNSGNDGGNITVSLAVDGLLGMGNCRIAVVSPGGDEGSLTTWSLARKLADAGKMVAVMDMTGSGVTSVQMLGNSTMNGIRDVLAGKSELNQIIRRDPHSSAKVVPAGVSVPIDVNAAQQRLSHMVDALSESHDYLIIDCGFADLGGITRVADFDTVILVSMIGSDKARDLESELISVGFVETISVNPSPEELREIENVAA